jgi:PAS domain S-box-containing protein
MGSRSTTSKPGCFASTRASWHRSSHCERPLEALVGLTRFLARSQDLREALQAVIRSITDSLGVRSCRIILAREGDSVGHVAASSRAGGADTTGPGESVDLEAHPEIEQVLSTGETLFTIVTLNGTADASDPDPGTPGSERRVAVVPIGYDGARHGVLYVVPGVGSELGDAERSFLELVANVAAMTLRNAQMSESLSYEKRQVSLHRARVEHRIKFFQRYADFFESAADGMVVVDHAGRILFSNPRASEISGYSSSELDGAGVLRFLSRKEIGRAAKIVRGFRSGVYPRGVDIRFIPKSSRGETEPRELILNVTFSPVLRAERAVLFMFRDVTLERATEVELRRTTEFLARVIDSSVDAIVSADLTGRVLLFNRAAARIFGYEPDQVIGKLSVERLYPSGVARQVMRRIRSAEHGGPRRLEDYRVDMMGSRGETIPVKLSAALIMDGEKAIGSVGVFTDIREQLRMESSLQTAQEELREREKGLALAELAGAAAHELNQPLTAVIGYAELLLRQLAGDAAHRPAAEVILEQAQRMAGIVQKIGKITRYETRSYVGDTKILDLDKAAPEGE